jgi:succinyl-diaminopimelate desuccinylase
VKGVRFIPLDVGRVCTELVRINSENPPGDTTAVVEHIGGILDAIGMDYRIFDNPGGRSNLVSIGAENRLLLCGHVDVVPALGEDWRYDPYSGAEEAGYIWGRGTSDMKGGCAAILAGLVLALEKGIEPGANLCFVCDEETSGVYGISSLLAQQCLPLPDCVIAEPTPMLHPVVGQKGLCRLVLEFHGEPGHASLYPRVGRSAVMEAFSLMGFLRELHEREYVPEGEMAEIVDRSALVLEDLFGMRKLAEIFRRITYNPGRIEGGEKVNVVAQHCTLELDLRVPWGCSAEGVKAAILEYARQASVVESHVASPSYTSRESRIVRTVCDEVSRVQGSTATPIVQWAASDAKFLRAEGFPVVEYGPGEITTLHAVDERVRVRDLERASEVYCGIIAAYSNR